MRVGVLAGSFDPITNGHVHIIRQALRIVDELHVLIASNPMKKPYINTHDRLVITQRVLADLITAKRVFVDVLGNEFAADYAFKKNADIMIRGIRNTIDLTYELGVSEVNSKINPLIQTVFIPTPAKLTEVSSSMVRGLVGIPGWELVVEEYVPPEVLTYLQGRR